MFRHIIIFSMPTRWPKPLYMFRSIWTAASRRLPPFHSVSTYWLLNDARHWHPQREKRCKNIRPWRKRRNWCTYNSNWCYFTSKRNVIRSLPDAWKQLGQVAVDSEEHQWVGAATHPAAGPPWIPFLPPFFVDHPSALPCLSSLNCRTFSQGVSA